MKFSVRVKGQPYALRLHQQHDAAWQACEASFLEAGELLPLNARGEAALSSTQQRWLLEVREPGGAVVAVVGISATPTRSLPGHLTLYVDRFGSAVDELARFAALAGLLRVAKEHGRVLRLQLRMFSRDGAKRQRLARWAAALGMESVEQTRSYRQTVSIALDEAEEAIWSRLHPTARRHVRAVGKNPVELRCIEDPDEAPALDELLAAAMERTGGQVAPRDWRRRIALARACPHLLRIVGLYRAGTGELLAFASGHAHGDHVEYADAGSARVEDLRLPLGYAPAWELICWAKEIGAHWFDFGGVTDGSLLRQEGSPASDRLAGISDFKRYFRGDVVSVADEWAYEPHRVRALVAQGTAGGAKMGRKALSALDSTLARIGTGALKVRETVELIMAGADGPIPPNEDS